MDPVNGLNQIMQLLRQRLAQKTSKNKKSFSSSDTTQSKNTTNRPAIKASPEEIQKRIGEKIRALPPKEQHGDKATQIFVETILIWEFGDEILQDSSFTELAREVQQSIAENTVVQKKLSSLLSKL